MSELVNFADIIRLKYLFEIDREFDIAKFLKIKFKEDQKNIKKICSSIYKKHK